MNEYEKLRKELQLKGTGKMVCFGDSMIPLIESGGEITFVKQKEYTIGDIVFCVVDRFWVDAHIITGGDKTNGFMISDNHGNKNGIARYIFGKAISVEYSDGRVRKL